MPETDIETDPSTLERTKRYARGAAMLRDWIAESDQEDENGYDWDAINREQRGSIHHN